MPRTYRRRRGPRVPLPEKGIQVNLCRTAWCGNFGVPASPDPQPRGRNATVRGGDGYRISGRTARRGGSETNLFCNTCNRQFTIKSNLGILEEFERLSSYLNGNHSPGSCPDPECANYGTSVRAGTRHYYTHGRTRSGSLRFKCRICGKVFSIGVSTLRHKKPHKNADVLTRLLSKTPFRLICWGAGIKAPAFYGKIDFLRKQCLAFAADRERRLLEGRLQKWSLYIGVDRQDYIVNWRTTEDKRNIQLSAIASTENPSGYVFGVHLNFDPAMDPEAAEEETLDLDEFDGRDTAYRRHARLWLRGDYPEHEAERYARRNGAEDEEPVEVMDDDTMLPVKGMQVHVEYTMYGHFFFLKKLFGKSITKTRFYLDRDAGMGGACIAAFADEIRQDRCHVFSVGIEKGLSTTKKLRRINQSLDELDDFMGRPRRNGANGNGRPGSSGMRAGSKALTDEDRKMYREAAIEKIKADLRTIVREAPPQARTLKHPLPDMGEPGKEVLHLTDTGRITERELSWLYFRASLHSVDNFFQQVRRRMAMLERPITPASNRGRRWHGYNAYNPEMISKLLDIFRVYYNYCKVGEDKKTPAMRLGLAKGPVDLMKIVHYSPALSPLVPDDDQ